MVEYNRAIERGGNPLSNYLVDFSFDLHYNIFMSTAVRENKTQKLELQLELAIQMLKLVAENKRTCLEVKEWLEQNHPEDQNNQEIVNALMKQK